MAKKGKTPLQLAYTPLWQKLIRALQILPAFDRIQLGILIDEEFGTCSGRLSELHNEGYIQPILDAEGKPVKGKYSEGSLKRNPELKGRNLNYAKGKSKKFPGSETFEKSARFSELITRWRGVVIAHYRKHNLLQPSVKKQKA